MRIFTWLVYVILLVARLTISLKNKEVYMKKSVLLAVAVTLLTAGVAQASKGEYSVGKGSWLVGAAADVTHFWGSGTNQTNFALDTEIGYFVWDWLMPELRFDLDIGDDFDAELFTAGARAYYNKGNELLPYVRLNVGFGSVKAGTRANAFVINPGIGLDYLLTKNVAIGIQANFNAYVRDVSFYSFDFPIGFNIYF